MHFQQFQASAISKKYAITQLSALKKNVLLRYFLSEVTFV